MSPQSTSLFSPFLFLSLAVVAELTPGQQRSMSHGAAFLFLSFLSLVCVCCYVVAGCFPKRRIKKMAEKQPIPVQSTQARPVSPPLLVLMHCWTEEPITGLVRPIRQEDDKRVRSSHCVSSYSRPNLSHPSRHDTQNREPFEKLSVYKEVKNNKKQKR